MVAEGAAPDPTAEVFPTDVPEDARSEERAPPDRPSDLLGAIVYSWVPNLLNTHKRPWIFTGSH